MKKTSDQGQILEKVPYEQVKQYPSLAPGQYNPQQYQPVQYAVAPANQQVAYAQTGVQPQQQQPITVVQDKKSGKLHSIGGKLGNAAIFGAGATSMYLSVHYNKGLMRYSWRQHRQRHLLITQGRSGKDKIVCHLQRVGRLF